MINPWTPDRAAFNQLVLGNWTYGERCQLLLFSRMMVGPPCTGPEDTDTWKREHRK